MRSDLECAIRDQRDRFLDDEITLHELDEWFTPVTLHIEQVDDPGADELTWEIMLRLAEYSNGHRTLTNLKDILRSFVTASVASVPRR